MADAAGSAGERGPIHVELDVLARAVAGAMLFGMPMLFTMELWWLGEFADAWRVDALLLLALAVNTGLARMGGFRRAHATLRADLAQAVEALAVGIVLAAVVLVALGQLEASSITGVLGMVAILAVPLSLGASVANLLFDPDTGRSGDYEHASPAVELAKDVGATFAGAVFFGFAIAPTDEIPMIAAGMGLWQLVSLVGLSFLASYLIVFASGFDPSHHQPHDSGLFQHPLSETVLAYVVSLVAALALLAAFGHLHTGETLRSIVAQVVVLGLPATIGGAAGRVVV